MNPIYAKNVLSDVTGQEYNFEENRETIHAMSAALQEAYKAGQNNPYAELLNEMEASRHIRVRVADLHVIGDYVIVETVNRDADKPNLYGVWSTKGRETGRIVCDYASLEDAILASVILHNTDAQYWGDANEVLYYAKRVMGIKEKKES